MLILLDEQIAAIDEVDHGFRKLRGKSAARRLVELVAIGASAEKKPRRRARSVKAADGEHAQKVDDAGVE